MCLDKKGRFKPCKVGYKIMRLTEDGDLVGEYRSRVEVRKIGTWLDESDFRDSSELYLLTDISDSQYPLGWHIYHDEKVARGRVIYSNSVVVKVSVKEHLAVGYQCSRRVTIAKKN